MIWDVHIEYEANWSLPPGANDNDHLMLEGVTPAEFMQWLNRLRGEMQRELAANFRLRSDAKHRRIWDQLDAMERCARWHYFGERDYREG